MASILVIILTLLSYISYWIYAYYILIYWWMCTVIVLGNRWSFNACCIGFLTLSSRPWRIRSGGWPRCWVIQTSWSCIGHRWVFRVCCCSSLRGEYQIRSSHSFWTIWTQIWADHPQDTNYCWSTSELNPKQTVS